MKKCKKIINNKSLANGKIGVIYSIIGFSNNIRLEYLERLKRLGFIKNEKIKIVRISLGGKTFLVGVMGGLISIQKNLANQIFVKE